jgi:hypothetical protein
MRCRLPSSPSAIIRGIAFVGLKRHRPNGCYDTCAAPPVDEGGSRRGANHRFTALFVGTPLWLPALRRY